MRCYQITAPVILCFCAIIFSHSRSVFAEPCKKTAILEKGSCLPSLNLKSLRGKKYTPSDLKDKVVLLHFWATWCQPCAKELPALQKLYKSLDPDNILLITLSVDKDKGALDRFFTNVFQGKWPEFPIVLDSEKKIANMFNNEKVPETFIVAPDGKIVSKIIGKREEWADDVILRDYFSLLRSTNK